jgi:hypothetical protein
MPLLPLGVGGWVSIFKRLLCGVRCQPCDLARSPAFDSDETGVDGPGSWSKDKIITGYSSDHRK